MRKGNEIITWKHGTRIGTKNQELGTKNKKTRHYYRVSGSYVRNDYWVNLFAYGFFNFNVFQRDHGDERTVISPFAEFNPAINECEKRVVFSHAYINTGIVPGSSLADNNISGLGELPSVYLHSQPLAV